MPSCTATFVLTDKATGKATTVTAQCLVGAAGLAGATVNPEGMGLSDYPTAAQQFNTCTGTALATSLQKGYGNEGQWWLTPKAIPVQYGQLAAFGCQWFLSLKPLRTGVVAGGTPNATGQSEIANLAATLAAFKAAGITIHGVTLWQEANCLDSNGVPFFATAQAYQDYVTCYGPTVVAAGIPLIYDPALTPEQYSQAISYLPAAGGLITRLYLDYYGTANKAGVLLNAAYQGAGPPGGVLELAADNNISIVGLGEWGNSATGNAITQAEFETYSGHVLNVFTGRLAAGEENGAVIWYSGKGLNGPNIIVSATDPKVPYVLAAYQQTSLQVLGA